MDDHLGQHQEEADKEVLQLCGATDRECINENVGGKVQPEPQISSAQIFQLLVSPSAVLRELQLMTLLATAIAIWY